MDVVIQTSCRTIDSFLHRSGRTARQNKEGLNILFIEPDDIKWAYELETKLNINIDILNDLNLDDDSNDNAIDKFT